MASRAVPLPELPEPCKPLGVQRIPSAAKPVEWSVSGHPCAGKVHDGVDKVRPDEIAFAIVSLKTFADAPIRTQVHYGIGESPGAYEPAIFNHAFDQIRKIRDGSVA